MLTIKEIKELKDLKRKISHCRGRIDNTLNVKTEERIRKEMVPLEKRKNVLFKKLEKGAD